ncbi:MAG: hypothetical protein HQL52_09640 [Magnetococcales bacterium]|nr:hypothetical protein [Magnetococcales bacterium]
MKATSPKNLEWLGKTAILTAFLTALLYASGWSYGVHHFNLYDVGLLGLKLPKEVFFLYGFMAWKSHWLFALLLFFAAIGVSSLPQRWPHMAYLPTLLHVLAILTIPIMIIIGIQLGGMRAKELYDSQKEAGFPRFPTVKVWLKEKSAIPEESGIKQELAAGCYRLLLNNDKFLYLFKVTPEEGHKRHPTVAIPTSETAGWQRHSANGCQT